MLQLRDTAVLVTGAGRGLGWGIARAFGRAGAKVCVTDLDEEELARCARDLAADGTTHHTRRSDVGDLTECATVVKAIVNLWGRLDVVVHCAIYMPLIGFEALPPEEWWRQITVGLGGLFNYAHAAWPHMKSQGGGHVIGIASGSSLRGYKDEVAYCTVKHGVEGFVKALSLEARAHNIALNTIGPGAPIKPTRMTWSEYDQGPDGPARGVGGSGRTRSGLGLACRSAARPVQRLSIRRRAAGADNRAGGARLLVRPGKGHALSRRLSREAGMVPQLRRLAGGTHL
jgi:NAD(P)-dependent dehydrogenase (short-subunit alcohol dehydrogenase family)